FVWRPAGSRHVAWAPEGGLMLAMFQLPNKFYERDGRVTDANGEDWETVWGRLYKDSARVDRARARNPARGRGEMVGARDLKSLGGNPVPVQVRPSAPAR